jgi:hypothetical protein
MFTKKHREMMSERAMARQQRRFEREKERELMVRVAREERYTTSLSLNFVDILNCNPHQGDADRHKEREGKSILGGEG